MAEVIKQSELRNDNAAIMRRVARGERFTVTVNGVPVADLVPHQRDQRRTTIPAAEVDALLRGLPPIDVEHWDRDMSEIDDLLGDSALGPAQDDEVHPDPTSQ
ncbi:type II toxin-antitoxin system Phd/YefM family antitoxin [Pseudonocardia spinosispora]|uniref:type II toxin-antitoxin system Phd/YefM family antitoxin n=1 Tax=Pseudonocardia spinosispora TaxID=103441 RepID=UPI00041A2DDE|nr:type II toxin-antitoxin system prevent-host-death family antitoxin [Pseudonocardia spinosispora]